MRSRPRAPMVPHNPRAVLRKIALFAATGHDIDIPRRPMPARSCSTARPAGRAVRRRATCCCATSRPATRCSRATPTTARTRSLVIRQYDVVYRVETPGPVTPNNDGAVLSGFWLSDDHASRCSITSVGLQRLVQDRRRLPAPPSEYDDANIELESATAGTMKLGNTHDGSYDVQVIPGSYTTVYRHETGVNVPQNKRARLEPEPSRSARGHDPRRSTCRWSRLPAA